MHLYLLLISHVDLKINTHTKCNILLDCVWSFDSTHEQTTIYNLASYQALIHRLVLVGNAKLMLMLIIFIGYGWLVVYVF